MGLFDSVASANTGGLWDTLSGKDAQDAAGRASALQAAAADKATAENKRQFDIGQENLAPWLAAGKAGLSSQQEIMGLSGNPSAQIAALQSSPGYQFRLAQGQRGLNAGLSARGGMGSGRAMNAATEYGQNFATNEYGNRLNQLSALSGTGRSTAGDMGNMGSAYAQNQGNIWTGTANAQGAADMAGANARQSGLLGMLGAGARVFGAK